MTEQELVDRWSKLMVELDQLDDDLGYDRPWTWRPWSQRTNPHLQGTVEFDQWAAVAAHGQALEAEKDAVSAEHEALRRMRVPGPPDIPLPPGGIELIGDQDAVAHGFSPSRMASISARSASRSESRTSPMWPMRKVEGFQSP